ncbi:MAG: hypothetical protein U9Q58_05195 [Pseudomonadota bacterium]|nr:hypothetical protein [Pseudomonadota bacterium]
MSLTPDTYICPVSKLPILNKPEWNKVGFGNEYKISADIIGEQILLTHNFGSPTLYDVQNAMNFTATIIDQYFQDRPYIHIFNYNEIRQNVSLETRRLVINEMKKRDRMLTAIYYGLTTSLKLSIKIGRFFHLVPFTTLIAQDYIEAIETALIILNDSEKNPLIVKKTETLDHETSQFIEDLSQKEAIFGNADPNPFDRAVELIEDEIQYFEEKNDKIKRHKTLARLEKIIHNRNEKSRIYQKSLRPTSTGNYLRNKLEKREDA